MSMVFYLNIVYEFEMYYSLRLNSLERRVDFPLFTVYEVPKFIIIQHCLYI
jgi:hypothetical protein